MRFIINLSFWKTTVGYFEWLPFQQNGCDSMVIGAGISNVCLFCVFFVTSYLKNRILHMRVLFWTEFVKKDVDWRSFYSDEKKSDRHEKIQFFCSIAKLDTFQICQKHIKNLNSHKMIFCDKIRWRRVGPLKITEFQPFRQDPWKIWIFIQWMIVHFIRHIFVFQSRCGMIRLTDAQA